MDNVLSKSGERMLIRRWGLSTQRVQLEKAMTFRFGDDIFASGIFGYEYEEKTDYVECENDLKKRFLVIREEHVCDVRSRVIMDSDKTCGMMQI